MAIIKCRECHKEVSTKADVCPHCGAPQKKQKRKPIGCGAGILIIFLIVFLASQISQCNSEHRERQQAKDQARAQQEKQEKIDQQRSAFELQVDKHYSNLVEAYNNDNFKEVLKIAKNFKKYKKYDYKDVKEIATESEIKLLVEKVRLLPSSNVKANLDAYKRLSQLSPTVKKYKDKVAFYHKKWSRLQKEKEDRKYRASCKLELLDSNWYEEYGYVTYEGRVKNISNDRLKNIEAVVTWYDKNGSLVTSDSSIIQYNPILPGQTSPFKVMGIHNPAMRKAGVAFSHLMGGTINTYRK